MTLAASSPAPAAKTDRPKPLAPSYALIIRVLNLVRNEAEISQIEAELRKDIALSYRLLRTINSAAMGFPSHITSYRQAVTLLGYHELYRWLTLLLLTADPDPSRSEVVRSSLIRGRFLESIGKRRFHRREADDLFVVGIFSRLDDLLGQPMPVILDVIKISPAMHAALIDRTGAYGELLSLAEALEADGDDVRERLQAQLDIEPIDVHMAQEDAVAWAKSVQP
ncbi:MAG: HDOD domain-containing protein [Burkholderiales bacterium]|nr:HDOD domain-containing protein [Burkholderiales bacterium]